MPGSVTGNAAIRLLAALLADAASRTLGPWVRQAACAGSDPDVFFPPKHDHGEAARRICARCPVRGECLAYALEADENYGIWGGLDGNERRALRRKLTKRRSRERGAA
jgi:WhiB family transcriptional regulator, redox-sensing transcriptional regulator